VVAEPWAAARRGTPIASSSWLKGVKNLLEVIDLKIDLGDREDL
jgi:hypothetical protein